MALRVVSWNLDGLDETRLDERMEAFCMGLLMQEDWPDVVLLQEVVDRAYLAHLRPHFGHAGFQAVRQPPLASYGCAAFFRAETCKVEEARVVPFEDTGMGRMLLEARMRWQDTDVVVSTAHLESLKEGGPIRVAQAAMAAMRLANEPAPALFAGDTNLRDKEARAIPALAAVTDAWQAAGAPADARHTWHNDRNSGREVARPFGIRFDRMWVNSGFRVERFELLGAEPVVDDWCVSDHLGLLVELSLT